MLLCWDYMHIIKAHSVPLCLKYLFDLSSSKEGSAGMHNKMKFTFTVTGLVIAIIYYASYNYCHWNIY